MKKLLITGSSGFVGKKLVEFFSRNDKIHVFETTRVKEKSNSRTIYLDFLYQDSIDEVFKNYNFNIIVHLGGCSSQVLCENLQEKTYLTNVKGPIYLVKKAKKNNVDCFINFSSNKSIKPKSIYGKQKKEFETLINELSDSKFNCISYRCGNILKSPSSFLFEWHKMYKNNLRIESSGKNVFRNFISLENVTRDIEIIYSNLEVFKNCVVIPQMKEGEIYSFLKTFANFFKAKTKLIPNRNIDNLKDFILNENEFINIKIKYLENRTYGVVNYFSKNKDQIEDKNKIIQNLLTRFTKKEIKDIIKSII